MGLPAEAFSTRVAEACDHVLGSMRLTSERARFPLGVWHAHEYCRSGLALIGDAAHTIHPLAGQGANLGFLDCACLVEVLAGALGAGEDWTGLRVLRRYERWRRSENALMMALVDGLNRLFGTAHPAVSSLRRLGLGLVGRQAPLRRALIERALGVRGDLPKLVRGAA
jgi:2-octaprenylphenol hydroxylase